jgi:hypothetical protein
MKRTKDKIVRTDKDKPCPSCMNTFRSCPMDIVLALDRVPTGMEIAVIECPEYKKKEG